MFSNAGYQARAANMKRAPRHALPVFEAWLAQLRSWPDVVFLNPWLIVSNLLHAFSLPAMLPSIVSASSIRTVVLATISHQLVVLLSVSRD